MSRISAVSSFLVVALVSGPTEVSRAGEDGGVNDALPKLQCSATLDIDNEGTFDDRALWNPNLWPGGNVYYTFNANVTAANQHAMRHAMDQIERVANIHFLPRTNQTAYIVVTNSTGNNSQVGRTGGAQTVNIFNWNLTYVMCHELMHALGQWHEQSRPDRANFVNINLANIQDAYEHNFAIVNAATVGTYDFDSVMHYDACGFSICCAAGSTCACDASCASIQTLPAYSQFQTSMGQSSHISVLDRAGLVAKYGPPADVSGPILGNGDFNSLPASLAPDASVPAGLWSFPATYVDAAVAEPVGREDTFSIVPNSSFQPGGTGNCLRLQNLEGESTDNFHLTNLFRKPMLAAAGLTVTVAFDLWVTSGFAGGSVYVGGDNGSGGFSNATDRTAQLTWLGTGDLAAANNAGTNIAIKPGYATDAWQNVRILIDTQSRNYDVYYGVNGGPQTKIGNDLVFRATTPAACWNYDRFSFVQFGATTPNILSYLDNLVVTSSLCAADFNGDGQVDDSDFVSFAGAYDLLLCDDPGMLGGCPADLNHDNSVDDLDFVSFAGAYDALLCP